jgi:hypothetical protein
MDARLDLDALRAQIGAPRRRARPQMADAAPQLRLTVALPPPHTPARANRLKSLEFAFSPPYTV